MASFLRLSGVRARVPLSRSAIYLEISRGKFPAPIKLGGRSVAWIEEEIDQWIAQQIKQNRPAENAK